MVILVGASASGKSVVAKDMIKRYGFSKVITYTTRSIRVGEVNNVDYHFVSKEEFIEKANNNFFIETACYNDNYYGTAYEDISRNKVLIVEPKGANVYYNKLKDDVKIIYLNATEEKRKNRMIERCDKIEDINKRLVNDEKYFSLSNLDHIDLVINTDALTIEEISDIIIKEYEKKA